MQKLSIFVLSIVATGALFWSSAQAQQAPAPGAQNPPAKASSQAPAKGPGTAKSGQASSRQTPAALTLNTPKDKLSYSIGMNIAKSLKRDDVDVDTAVLLRAIQDVLGGGNLLMTDQEAQSILTNLQRSEEHTYELQSLTNLVCRLLLEKKKEVSHKSAV